MVDPLYDDTLYVRHALGVHCIVMRKWMDALGAAIRVKDEGKRQGVVESVLGKGIGSVVGCVVDSISESGRFARLVALFLFSFSSSANCPRGIIFFSVLE